MANMTDYLEREVAKHIFLAGQFLKPSGLAVCLTPSPPLDTITVGSNIGELPNAGAYARQALNPSDSNWTFDSSTSTIYNAQTVTFPVATSAWGWVSGAVVCDSATYGAGSGLFRGTLTTPKYVDTNDQLIAQPSGLSFQFL